MCTAISFQTKDHYFGRNLDLEFSYDEKIVITPRNFPLVFRMGSTINSHLSIIGMATIKDEYPLYYDATNEAGLSMAALNFPGNSVYYDRSEEKTNISSFELIPWLLSQYKTVSQAREALSSLNITKDVFSRELPPTPLHWIIADRNESIVIESLASGLNIFENPVGVLTNNPPFDYHLLNLSNYINLSTNEAVNRFSNKINLKAYSRGMGAMGLPGDLSSSSRFIKATFTKLNSVCGESESDSISQFFHILKSVTQQRGCVKIGNSYEKTIYSSCCNTNQCIYYYTTYENHHICAVKLFHEDLDSRELIWYPLINDQHIYYQNK